MEIQAQGSQDSSLVDQYLSSPDELKSKVRAALGVKTDNEATALINTDSSAAQTAKKILSSILTSSAESLSPSPESIMYGA
jgi:hypothetical protein